MERKSFSENISEIRENFRLYLESKISLYTLIGFEKAVKALTVIISSSTVVLFMVISFFFFSAAAAIYIGRLLESIELGLVTIGGFYFFLGIVFFLFKKPIFSRLIISFLVEVLFKSDDDHEKSESTK